VEALQTGPFDLHAANLCAFGLPRHLEQHVCPDASLECRITICREIRSEDHNAVVTTRAPAAAADVVFDSR